jgi:hypothetical protein
MAGCESSSRPRSNTASSGNNSWAKTRLKIDAVLAQDQTLLVTSIPERSGSLGRYLFSQSGPAVEQKLLMIRLSESKFDDLFADAAAGDVKPVNPLNAKPQPAATATTK